MVVVVRGWRWDQACSTEAEGWGRRMLHSGSCLALKSHLAPHPLPSALREGEGQVAGAGGTAWTSANGATRLVRKTDPSHTKCLLSFMSGRTSYMTLERHGLPSVCALVSGY